MDFFFLFLYLFRFNTLLHVCFAGFDPTEAKVPYRSLRKTRNVATALTEYGTRTTRAQPHGRANADKLTRVRAQSVPPLLLPLLCWWCESTQVACGGRESTLNMLSLACALSSAICLAWGDLEFDTQLQLAGERNTERNKESAPY